MPPFWQAVGNLIRDPQSPHPSPGVQPARSKPRLPASLRGDKGYLDFSSGRASQTFTVKVSATADDPASVWTEAHATDFCVSFECERLLAGLGIPDLHRGVPYAVADDPLPVGAETHAVDST